MKPDDEMILMMSEYKHPENIVAQSAIGDEDKSGRKRKNSWRYNNNILDLDAIEKSSKAFSSRDASEINESPMMSPTHVGGRGKKSRFAPLESYGKQMSQEQLHGVSPHY